MRRLLKLSSVTEELQAKIFGGGTSSNDSQPGPCPHLGPGPGPWRLNRARARIVAEKRVMCAGWSASPVWWSSNRGRGD